uniref:Uncharacterized protein n=1 Tax=Molossus molossus TaxID=27622 RepID=A0A7J8HIN7_MOLMO|nr:hypothetical protein HJG59_010923 [Molossus molossus]
MAQELVRERPCPALSTKDSSHGPGQGNRNRKCPHVINNLHIEKETGKAKIKKSCSPRQCCLLPVIEPATWHAPWLGAHVRPGFYPCWPRFEVSSPSFRHIPPASSTYKRPRMWDPTTTQASSGFGQFFVD